MRPFAPVRLAALSLTALSLSGCVRLAPRCDEPLSGFLDADGDGYGDGAIDGCVGDVWIAPEDGDCDDAEPAASPDGIEVWYDGVDGDCDGADDFDQDGDGYAADTFAGDDCDDTRDDVYPGHGEVPYNGVDDACDGGDDYDQDGDGDRAEAHGGGDCDDTDATISSDAAEAWYDGVDQDCDGANDFDQDGDGWVPEAWAEEAGELQAGDCDDLHADANPDGVEDCDGVDDDCDGVVDDGFDIDGDGFAGCVEDCDDADATVFPGAVETCDGVDQDCDAAIDEDFDLDLDGWATCGGDCDDADGAVSPGAEEAWYDGVDQDCDGASDYDQDGDGVDVGADCDDTAPAVYPGAPEVPYDGVDQDCDEADLVDVDGDGFDAEVAGGADCDDDDGAVNPGAAERWYDDVDQDCDGASDHDQDGDGFDNAATSTGEDCDDVDPAVRPDATEIWYDGVDQDCDGASDDDQDGDGFDTDAADGDDCDDTDADINPAAIDYLDGVDDNCSGIADDPDAEDVAIAVVRGVTGDQAIGSGGVALAADLDSDGEDELVLASAADAGGGADAGAVWIFEWSELGDVPVTDAWLTIEGGAGNEVGAALATGLDWDDNGVGDLAVGAPGIDTLYLMEPGTASSARHAATTLEYRTITGTASSEFGAAVCTGDLDGDGTSDLVAGAPGASSGRGAVYVFLGGGSATSVSAANYTVPGADSGDGIGTVLACGGDVSGDGLDDLAVGVPGDDENSRSNSGSVFLVLGSSLYLPLGLSVEAVDAWTLTGSAASQAVGSSVTIADVSGTGNADVIVGATGYSWSGGTGAVGVFQGSSSGSESFTAADRLIRGDGSLGSAVGASSDLDGDGTNDLLLGASDAGSDEDVAWLVTLTGTSGTLDLVGDQLARFGGGATRLGAAVSATARDLDGDGVDEVAVAAPDDAGAVYLLNVFP